MNKYNVGLLATMILCSVVTNLGASENQEKPFFDQKTQGVLKTTAKYYGYGYTGAWAVGNGVNVAAFTLFAPLATIVGMVAGDSKMVAEALSPWSTLKQGNRDVCKRLLRTTPVTAPIFFGTVLAWHKYKENLADKE